MENEPKKRKKIGLANRFNRYANRNSMNISSLNEAVLIEKNKKQNSTSQQSFDDLESTLDEYKNENKDLENDLKNIRKSFEIIDNQNTDLIKENNELKEENETLKTRIEIYAAGCDACDIAGKIRDRVVFLTEENARLKEVISGEQKNFFNNNKKEA